MKSWANELEGLASASRYLRLLAHPKQSVQSWKAIYNNVRPERIYVVCSQMNHLSLQLAELQFTTVVGIIKAKGDSQVLSERPQAAQQWYLHASETPEEYGAWVFGCTMLEVIMFAKLTADRSDGTEANSAVSTLDAKKQTLKASVLSKTSLPDACREFSTSVKYPSHKARPVWSLLTDLIAKICAVGTGRRVTIKDVYQKMRILSKVEDEGSEVGGVEVEEVEDEGVKDEESSCGHLRLFAAAVQCARQIMDDDANVKYGLEAAELLLGQDPRG